MFIVIQHAPLNIQETFYPKMKEALQSGNLRPQDFALFVDKLVINKGEKQIYGTQVKFDDEIGGYIVLPIQNPESVNELRVKVGLKPIEEYLSFYGISWEERKNQK